MVVAAVLAAPAAQAFEIDTGTPGLRILWDTTAKYSTGVRLEQPNSTITNPPFFYFANTDDGDRNFKRGSLISNRFDVLSEFDVSYQGFGARASGAAWYDFAYAGHTDNDSPASNNALSTGNRNFTQGTKDIHKSKAELLDAFVFGKADVGSSKLTFRAGQHTLLWGETLFFGANGIAGGQSPIDIAKAVSVPNTQFKELIRPVPQLSAQFQVNSDVSVGAYYQLMWQKHRFPGSGSYFSMADMFGPGAESLIVSRVSGLGALGIPDHNIYFGRTSDEEAKNQGQGGAQVRFRVGDYDFGLYAINYHEKAPQIYLMPGVGADFANGRVGQYRWVYPENIQAYGFSASTTIDNYNLAFETSIRRNTPLASDAVVDTGGGNNSSNPLYAVGNSYHANLSWLAALGPSFIAREADFVGEVAYNRLLNVTKNRAILNPRADRDAANVRFVYEPKYRQVLPGLDVSVPFGAGFGFIGNSAVVGAFSGRGSGDFNIGVNGTYLDVWRFGLSYTHYFGRQGNAFDEQGHASYLQALGDRDYVAFNVRRTF